MPWSNFLSDWTLRSGWHWTSEVTMVMYGACKSLAILQQLELPFQVLTSVYHILNYGSSQNRLHFARFVWFLHPCFISLHLFSSPLQCLLASLLSLLYLCCFLFAFSDFFICPPLVFLDGYISISLRTVSFPAILGLFRHEWLTTASFLFSVFARLTLLSLRV